MISTQSEIVLGATLLEIYSQVRELAIESFNLRLQEDQKQLYLACGLFYSNLETLSKTNDARV